MHYVTPMALVMHSLREHGGCDKFGWGASARRIWWVKGGAERERARGRGRERDTHTHRGRGRDRDRDRDRQRYTDANRQTDCVREKQFQRNCTQASRCAMIIVQPAERQKESVLALVHVTEDVGVRQEMRVRLCFVEGASCRVPEGRRGGGGLGGYKGGEKGGGRLV